MRFVPLLIAVALAACVPAPVAPPSPDASDAAPPPPPLGDGAPMTPCQAACDALAAAGCPEGTAANCATVEAHLEADRLKRNPATGLPLTCVDVAAVRSAAGARAIGIACGGGT